MGYGKIGGFSRRDERNFVEKSVSWALHAIGQRSVSLKSVAAALAQKLVASEDSAARWIGKDALQSLIRG